MTNLEGYGQHKFSTLIVIADASGAVSASLGYTVSTNGSTTYASSCSTDPKLMRG